MKQQILDILQDYCADEAMTAEIITAIDSWNKDTLQIIENHSMGVFPAAVSILQTKPVTQQSIHDWATLNGYVALKVNSMAARLRVENIAREIWGEDYMRYWLE